MSTNPHEDPYRAQPDSVFLSKTDIIRWEDGRTFHTDWAAHNFFQWAELLHGLRNRLVRILEIGSWEGRSALFFLNFLPHSIILCIDPFAGNAEHQQNPYWVELARKSERQFDHNLAGYESRVEKVVGSSADVLPRLGTAGRRFDLAYIDGSHVAADVYRDGVLVWSMLDRGGIAVFDDYEWPMMDAPEQRPKLGVDRFLAAHAGHSTASFSATISSRSKRCSSNRSGARVGLAMRPRKRGGLEARRRNEESEAEDLRSTWVESRCCPPIRLVVWSIGSCRPIQGSFGGGKNEPAKSNVGDDAL